MPQFIDDQHAEIQLQNCQQLFIQKSPLITAKPVPQRHINDCLCFIIFILFFSTFIAYSAYSIHMMAVMPQLQPISGQPGTIFQNVTNQKMKTFAIIIFLCLGGSVFVSLILCGFLCLCPKIGVLVMAAAGSIIVTAIALFLVIATFQVLGKYSALFFMLAIGYISLICAFKQQLQSAAILMKTIKLFISDNPKIILLVFISLIYCLLVLCLWCLGFYSFCIRYQQNQLQYNGFIGSSIFWAFLLVFFNYYFYYTSVYLTSCSLAIWFYQVDGMDAMSTPLKFMVKGGLGTITFASLVFAFVNVLKFFFFFGRLQNKQGFLFCIGKFCSLFVYFCLGCLQPLSQVLNSYAIITSSLTGQSFITSARIIAHIAFQDFTAFSNFAVVGYMMRLGTIFFTCSIPTIIGIILFTQLLQNNYLTMAGSALIIFTTSIIGMVILQIFVQSINALFVMYRIDAELSNTGHEITWVQQFGEQLQKGFDQASIDHLMKKPQPKYRKVTTVVVHQNGVTQVFENKIIVPDGKMETSMQQL